MSVRSFTSVFLFVVAALALGSFVSAQGPVGALAPNGPAGPPLPEPLTWTILTMAATGTGFAVAGRRKQAETDEPSQES